MMYSHTATQIHIDKAAIELTSVWLDSLCLLHPNYIHSLKSQHQVTKLVTKVFKSSVLGQSTLLCTLNIL